mmetsp:Transcript_13556/g.29475  ORF Transcript_13556/g.29475 Transcript_13556/m.29475 type:complete len:85 (+) Transcript_13556:926-1180(+)
MCLEKLEMGLERGQVLLGRVVDHFHWSAFSPLHWNWGQVIFGKSSGSVSWGASLTFSPSILKIYLIVRHDIWSYSKNDKKQSWF